MATTTVSILERTRLPGGRVAVVYCAPGTPGVQYGVTSLSNSDADVDDAIAAHIRQRKAAGIDYAGRPEPTTAERTIFF